MTRSLRRDGTPPATRPVPEPYRDGLGAQRPGDGNITVTLLDGNNTVSYPEGIITVRRDHVVARGEVNSPAALGRMLQQGRLVSGLTQRELAERLHTDQKYVWSLEAGKDSIMLERIFEIMRQTGLRMYMEIDTPEPGVQPPEAHHG